MGEDESQVNKISRRSFLMGTGAFILLAASGGKWEKLEAILGSKAEATRSPNGAEKPANNDVDAPFTIFWITDTQYLAETDPALYNQTTEWIVKNWKQFNGKLVIHTGDLVQDGDRLLEWANADAAMQVLTDNNIPYLWCAGNHDDIIQDDPTFGWVGHQFDSFDPLTVADRVNSYGYTRWAGDYRNGMNTAVAFTANDTNFLVVNLEWDAPPDVMRWLEGLLSDSQYVNSYVIIAPHAYMDATGSMEDARWDPVLHEFREELRDIMDEHNENVFLTLNGHFASDSGYHTTQPINGRNQLMFDRQESTDNPADPVDSSVSDVLKVGGATVTLLAFDTSRNVVNVSTYDISKGAYRVNPLDQYSFPMLPYQNPRGNGPNGPSVSFELVKA